MAKLGEICTIYSGTGFPVQYQGNSSGQYPFYKVGDIAKNVTQGFSELKICENYIDDDICQAIKGTVIPEKTVVFAKIGEAVKLNRRAKTTVPCLIDNNAMGVKPNEDVLSLQYFYHFMCGLKLEEYAEATTVPSVKKTVIERIDIPLPPLETQRQIAANLDKVTHTIDLCNAILEKLDLLVKARFVEMFGEPILNPKGWEMATIGDIVTEVKYGTSKPAVDGGKYAYLRMNNLTYDGHLDLTDLKRIDIPDNEIEKCIVRKGDVLFNRTNSVELVGKTCVFNESEDMVIAGYIIRVRLKSVMLPIVLSSFMNTDALKKKLRTMAKGAVNQANINAQELQAINIYLPPIELQQQFSAFVEQTDKSKLAVKQVLEKAETLKKALMQEYFG